MSETKPEERKGRRPALDPRPGGPLPVSLLTRIFLTNAAVAAAAGVVLVVSPATVSSPPALREIVVVVGGLTAILVINLFLLRRAFAPLGRLTALMHDVEPLRPGRRVPVYGSDREITELTSAFNDMLERLEEERRESARRSLAAQEAERGRVARELHDEVGQSLTAVVLQLERARRTIDEAASREVAEAREAARASLEDVRNIAQRLRPEALDDLGLPSALAALVERLREQTGVRIERRLERELPPLAPEVELVIYRVAQEAVTNALRHAGASLVDVRLEGRPDAVALRISDDGRGLDGARPGTGIQGMRERALLVGAALAVEDRPQGGAEVRLEVPVGEAR